MDFGYYPGCALHGSSNDYGQSVRACLKAMGVELRELDDWICCGATAAHSLNHTLAVALPARNLAIAERDGLPNLLAPCPMCSMELLRAQSVMSTSDALRREMSEIVELPIRGGTRVLNLIQVLQQIGVEAIRSKAARPLSEFHPACYYGCLLTRPPETLRFDDCEHPDSMESILRALGAAPVDWNYKTECCGAGMTMADEVVVLDLSHKVLGDARRHGADCMVVACPMCHVNLDLKQADIERRHGCRHDLPVYYLSDLVGLVDFTYVYDKAARLREVHDSSTLMPSAEATTVYDYNSRNQLASVTQYGTDVADKRVEFAYAPDGQFQSIGRYADRDGVELVGATTYGYDAAGRLTGLVHYGADYDPENLPGSSVLAGYGYTYDGGGRIHTMTQSGQQAGLVYDGTTTFGYDATGQLTSIDYAQAVSQWLADRTFDYDETGNRELSVSGGQTDDYATDPHNRTRFDGHYTYAYDEEGNRTARFVDSGSQPGALDATDTEVTRYAWDHRNRLVEVSDYANGATATPALQTVCYTYDAFDRQIGRAVDSDGDGSFDEGQYTYNVYQDDEVYLQIADADGLSQPGHRPEVGQRYLYGAAVDQILAVDDGQGRVLWGLADHQGTVRDLAQYDDGTGQTTVVEHRRYDAFGKRADRGNPTGWALLDLSEFEFAYTGRPLDEATDLYNYRARWYDAALGRFASEDPIGLAGGDTNLYRYVGNSPANGTDPTGMFLTSTNHQTIKLSGGGSGSKGESSSKSSTSYHGTTYGGHSYDGSHSHSHSYGYQTTNSTSRPGEASSGAKMEAPTVANNVAWGEWNAAVYVNGMAGIPGDVYDGVYCSHSGEEDCLEPVGNGNSRSFGLESNPEPGGFHDEVTTALWDRPEGGHSQEASGR